MVNRFDDIIINDGNDKVSKKYLVPINAVLIKYISITSEGILGLFNIDDKIKLVQCFFESSQGLPLWLLSQLHLYKELSKLNRVYFMNYEEILQSSNHISLIFPVYQNRYVNLPREQQIQLLPKLLMLFMNVSKILRSHNFNINFDIQDVYVNSDYSLVIDLLKSKAPIDIDYFTSFDDIDTKLVLNIFDNFVTNFTIYSHNFLDAFQNLHPNSIDKIVDVDDFDNFPNEVVGVKIITEKTGTYILNELYLKLQGRFNSKVYFETILKNYRNILQTLSNDFYNWIDEIMSPGYISDNYEYEDTLKSSSPLVFNQYFFSKIAAQLITLEKYLTLDDYIAVISETFKNTSNIGYDSFTIIQTVLYNKDLSQYTNLIVNTSQQLKFIKNNDYVISTSIAAPLKKISFNLLTYTILYIIGILPSLPSIDHLITEISESLPNTEILFRTRRVDHDFRSLKYFKDESDLQFLPIYQGSKIGCNTLNSIIKTNIHLPNFIDKIRKITHTIQLLNPISPIEYGEVIQTLTNSEITVTEMLKVYRLLNKLAIDVLTNDNYWIYMEDVCKKVISDHNINGLKFLMYIGVKIPELVEINPSYHKSVEKVLNLSNIDENIIKIYSLNNGYLNVNQRYKVSQQIFNIIKLSSETRDLIEMIEDDIDIQGYQNSKALNFRYGNTPLSKFCNNLTKVRLLLDLGADPNTIYNDEIGYFYNIFNNDHPVELLKILESYDINHSLYTHKDFEGKNMLHHAVIHDAVDIIKYLKSDSDRARKLNVVDTNGYLPSHYTINKKIYDMVVN